MTTQCGNTEVHPAHADCAGLDGTEALDPLTVPCPDCMAPAGTGCYFGSGQDWPEGHVHAERTRSVTLRNVERGTCALCGQQMVRTPDGDAWHPVAALLVPCPVLPDPTTQWEAYAAIVNDTGVEPGRPGPQHFLPAAVARCPECSNGKHVNCAHQALVGEELVPCACTHETPAQLNQPRPAHSDPMKAPGDH